MMLYKVRVITLETVDEKNHHSNESHKAVISYNTNGFLNISGKMKTELFLQFWFWESVNKNYLSAERSGAGPTSNHIHSNHVTLDVFASIPALNCTRSPLTIAYISAPLNCFDNNRRNECKQRTNNNQFPSELSLYLEPFYAVTRTSLMIPMGAIKHDKFPLIDISERLCDFDGPTGLACYNKGDNKCICRSIQNKKAKGKGAFWSRFCI